MELPGSFYCFWCGAEYHTCPTDYRGDCLQRKPEIVAGDFAYNQGAKAVVVEHIPTTTIVGRYPTLQAAKKAVAAGHWGYRTKAYRLSPLYDRMPYEFPHVKDAFAFRWAA